MRFALTAIIFILMFVFVNHCSNEDVSDEFSLPLIPSHERAYSKIRIIIKWAGDDFASRQDLTLRGEIERVILEKKVGTIIRSGTGMGWMDVIVAVKSKEKARLEIEAILRKLAPNFRFSIE